MGHVIGLHHEHTRVDRDDFISLITNRVSLKNQADKDRLSRNTDIKPFNVALPLGPYDSASLMHYPGISNLGAEAKIKIFLRPPLCSLNGPIPHDQNPAGKFSQLDIKAVEMLYGGPKCTYDHYADIQPRCGGWPQLM